MREIKFRAWNGDKIWSWSELLKDSEQDWHGFFIGRYPQVRLMQYTGLKSKSGQEIYEGDLVTCGTLDGNPVGQIVFIEANGQYEVCTKTTRLEHFTKMHTDHMEVIGNICENPELLTTGEPPMM